jgi:hypothetical protein
MRRGSGSFPEDDAAGFDGWYSDRQEALAVAKDWATRFPYWIVALVRSDQIWFGEGDYSGWKHPLTEREQQIIAHFRGTTPYNRMRNGINDDK